MFFRREKPKILTFQDRVARVKQAGFAVEETGKTAQVTRGECGALVEDRGGETPWVHRAGILVGKEIASVVHGGYQMFLLTPGGRKLPALARQLKAVHDFEEDLREAMDVISLYNVSLGSRASLHLYDRVKKLSSSGPLEEK